MSNIDKSNDFVFERYTANKGMKDSAFCNADGDFLLVPQTGSKLSRLGRDSFVIKV